MHDPDNPAPHEAQADTCAAPDDNKSSLALTRQSLDLARQRRAEALARDRRQWAADREQARAVRAAALKAARAVRAGAGKAARAAKRTAQQRVRRAAGKAALEASVGEALTGLTVAPPAVCPQALAADAAALARWLDRPGRRQGQMRGIERKHPGDLMATRAALLLCRLEFGDRPSWSELAERFGTATGRAWTREQARGRHVVLTDLEGPGGPWNEPGWEGFEGV